MHLNAGVVRVTLLTLLLLLLQQQQQQQQQQQHASTADANAAHSIAWHPYRVAAVRCRQQATSMQKLQKHKQR